MRTERRTRQVEYEVHITTDGKEFSNKSDAEEHEQFLNGTRKVCGRCNGKGKINIRTEKSIQPGYPDSEYEWGDTCSECTGKGFFELKWT